MKHSNENSADLRAFLLVAGRGERLKPLTDNIPKCLLPINGKPLLEIWLEKLEKSGVFDVLLNTHWLHEKVEDFVHKWIASHRKMRITIYHEQTLLGSAGTILANRNWAGDGPFFIIYGDNLTNFDLQKMLAFHIEYGQPITLRVYKGADPRRAGIVTVDDQSIITDFEEKPGKPKSDIGAGGIYIADSRVYDFFPDHHDVEKDGVLDLSYHVLNRMAGRMKAYDGGEFSIDIGTPESYEKAVRSWMDSKDADSRTE